MKLTKWYFWEYDFECALIDEKGNVLLSGDYYHDKIDSKIDGFILGLKHMGVEVEVETKENDGCFDDWKKSLNTPKDYELNRKDMKGE